MSVIADNKNITPNSIVIIMKRQLPLGWKIFFYFFGALIGIILSQFFNIILHEIGHFIILKCFGVYTRIFVSFPAAYTEFDINEMHSLPSYQIIFIIIAGYLIQFIFWGTILLFYVRFKRTFIGFIYLLVGFPIFSLIFHLFQPTSDLCLLLSLGYNTISIVLYIVFIIIAVFYLYFLAWKIQLGNRIVAFFSSGDEDE